ncbi:MAG: fibronectin type III domain-containing protein [Bacteroidales bacterium]|nr:fibronectin type III domain-containing protein [Bacteroidales bacterium]
MRKITRLLTLLIAVLCTSALVFAQSNTMSTSATKPIVAKETINNLQNASISDLQQNVEKKTSIIPYDPKQHPTPRQGGDDIATAFVISSLPYSATGTTTGYTDNYDAICPYNAPGSPDVVYSYTPASNGFIDISLCNDLTDYDTKLYVYDTQNPITGDEIACNDDACSTLNFPDPYVSQILGVEVFSGVTYYIVVDGYGGDNGNYEITVTQGIEPISLDCPPGTVFSLPPSAGYNSGSTSDVSPGYKVFNFFTGVEDVTSIRWWGVNAFFNGTSWEECSEDPRDFQVEFWNNDAGLPDLAGGSVANYNATLSGTPTANFFNGWEIYEYNLTVNVTLGSGWISIWGNPEGIANCWFMWMNTLETGTVAQQLAIATSTFTPTTQPMSMCLGGTLPACPPPSMLTASNILTTEANIGWTPGGSEVLWNVEVGLTGFTPGTGNEVASEYGTGDNPILVKDLTPGTTYEAYVQADCATREESSWAGPLVFTTLCEFTCPPEAIAESEACGDTINNGCNLVIPTFESVNPGDVICGTVWAEDDLRDTDWFELVLTEPTQVILHAYAETELVFGLLAGIDPTSPDCADVTGISPFDITEICTPVSLDLGVLVSGTHWFFAGLPIFDGYPCNINYWLEFETIEVECPPPTNLVATTLSTTSAELTWTAGGTEAEWEVAVVNANDPEPTSGTVVSSPSYTTTSLTLGSSYDAYVRAICVTRALSFWTKITFAVNYCPAGPTSADDSDLFRVQITGPDVNFDHNVGCTGILGAQDFTGLGAIQLQQGVEYTMTLTMGQCGTGAYTNVGKAWADWDQDVALVEPDERLGVVQGATSPTGVAYNFNFTVPLDAELGMTGLRVMQRETSDPLTVTPCAVYSWGSVHDYLIEVLPPPASPVFSILPTDWDFGDIEVGQQSAPKVFTISNEGPGVLTVSAPTLDNNVDFTLDYEATDYPAELEGTETVTFNVVFHPQSTGPATGEVSISYDDTEAIATVPLSGEGVVRPAGSTCGNPYPVSLPLVAYADNTEAYGNDYLGSWVTPATDYLNGYDFVAQFTLTEAGYLSGSVVGSWTGVIIVQDCPDAITPATRLALGSGSNGGSFTNVILSAGSYFAIVSTWPTPNFTAFTLNLSFEPLPTCPAPTSPLATAITEGSAQLGWTENGSATMWDIEYGVSPYTFTGTPTISGVTNPYTLSGLDPVTTYQFKVRSDCGEEQSDWSATQTFTTLCEVYSLPLLETFDGATFPPQCWSKYSGLLADPATLTTSTLGWISDDWLNIASNPDKAAKINIYGADRYFWLLSPLLDLGDGSSTYELSFDLALMTWNTSNPPETDGADDVFAVVISTNGGVTWTSANTLRLWDNAGSPYVYNDINYLGEEVVISLDGYTGVVQIGLYGGSTTVDADNDLMVNNFSIAVEEPTVPENRTVDGVTVGNGDDECFDATNNITVTNTVIAAGGIANFIAGVNIIFGDGFVVESGAYMWARIDNVYCNPPAMLLAIEETIEAVLPEITAPDAFFKVFPNPTTGNFKLELLSTDEVGINVEIYGMMGEKVFQDRLFGSMLYDFDLSNMPKGIYFIRVIKGDEMGIEKVIKQ